ncbi:MAG: BACON domain-containing protein [bacterium]|nr:BACON domain-containing protein [bacterium]
MNIARTFTAIIFTLLFVFVNISYGATFTTADLEGSWMYHTLSMDNGTRIIIAYGTLDVDSAGNITGGTYYDMNGHSGSITGDTLNISSDGILSGTFIDRDNTVTVINGGQMNAGKTLFNFVSTTQQENTWDFGVLTRSGGSFTTSDLAGIWHVDAIIHGAGNEGTGAMAAYGTVDIDASGNLNSATFTLSDGQNETYTSGNFSLTAGGVLTGSITEDDESFILTIVDGKIDRGKTTCALAATSSKENGITYLAYMSKVGASFTQADLSGNWYLCSPARDSWTGSGQWWRHGSISIDGSGNVSGGPLAISGGSSIANPSGSLSLNGSGRVGGSLTFNGQTTLNMVDGQLDQSKSIIHALQYDDNRGAVLYLVKENDTAGTLSLNRSRLNYGAVSGALSESQDISVSCYGGPVNWNASADQSWLDVSPSSGTGSATVTVTADTSGLSTGEYTGTVTVGDADNSATVAVYLTVYGSGTSEPPFGQYATPTEGATVSNSVPFTGWVLDDVGVDSVGLYLENNGVLQFIGNVVFVEGARPDIEQVYAQYPGSSAAGWGYMMLTHFLPDGGNGSYTIHAIAVDVEGKKTSLGIRTVTIDNANSVKPFGAIDTPTQGGPASGSTFRNVGWVLTPMPNKIPENGSTIGVYVDGDKIGNAVYNENRPDIEALFPGYANSTGAMAYFDIDTTDFENGIHNIFWVATDNAGNAEGIGSRYFQVQNAGNTRSASTHGYSMENAGYAGSVAGVGNTPNLSKRPLFSRIDSVDLAPLGIRKGFDSQTNIQWVMPDDKGNTPITLHQLERLEIHFKNRPLEGRMAVGTELRPLPVGAKLDKENSTFYWQPGPGFCGDYILCFTYCDAKNRVSRNTVHVRISEK